MKKAQRATNRFLTPDNSPVRVLFLLGTLKRGKEFSHTAVLCELLIEELKQYNTKSEIVRLVNFDIKPGVESDEGRGDEWPRILKKVIAADILIFATPIWWGTYSSLIQGVIERMDALNDELLETGKSELANKVGGIVITGAEDGAEHIIGSICNFLVWNGVTMPPACSLSFLGDYTGRTRASLLRKFRKQKSTRSMAKTMARNLVFFARLLKENNVPEESGGISQKLR
jgi:multimeric flavodoxin WrbA